MPYPIGKVYSGPTQTLTAAESAAYAAATSDFSRDYDGPDAICPPMIHVRLLLPVMEAVAGDPELGLDLLRLVHGEHDATFHRVLRPGDTVETRAILSEVTQKRSGLLVVSRLEAHTAGELAVSARTAYFIRAPRPADASPRPPKASTPELPAPDHVVYWQVDDDQSYRYATVSLDNNPIHTDPEVAAAAGLPSVILHGLCTMAMSGRTVLGAVGASPCQLRRLSVRFAGMVFNGMALQTQIWSEAPGRHAFAVCGPDGKPVISNGVVETRP